MRHQPVPLLLSWALVLMMAAQAILGRVYSTHYRDVDWIRVTWIGNDWVTLIVGVPLLVLALRWASRGSTRGVLVWLGMLGYGIYNYAFYLFGASLNVFFPLYIGALLLASTSLIFLLVGYRDQVVPLSFTGQRIIRGVGGYLAFIGVGLFAVWGVMWAAYVFGGHPTPVEPDAFKLVAALDSILMTPVLVGAGVLLWRRHPWGGALASIASVQGALYLLVLTVNASLSVGLGDTAFPGEIPVWGTLAFITALAAGLLLYRVRGGAGSP